MKKQHLILIGLIAVLNSSCSTYKFYPKEYRKLQNLKDKKTVYLINDYHKKEVEILKHSDIFNITTDSTRADLKIKLYPLKYPYYTEYYDYTIFGWNAGGDYTIGLITLGQLPIFYDDTVLFQYDEIEQDIIIKRNFELKFTNRIWFWNMFLKKRFEEKAGKALLGSYINNK